MVNKIKSEQIVVTLKKEDNLADSKLLVFCSASFENMTLWFLRRIYSLLV